MSTFTISKMQPQEVQIALDWAETEGWNPGLHDAACFYQADPNGFFIGKLEGEPIVVGSSVNYDDQFSFLGLYITKPSYRSMGYGKQLADVLFEYSGQRMGGLDGVYAMVDKYAEWGCQLAHRNTRYELAADPGFSMHPNVIELSLVPSHLIFEYDLHCFAAPREAFLKAWTTQPGTHALGYVKGNQLIGYGVMRQCKNGYKIGPLFADSLPVAGALFQSLISKVNAGPFYLDVPEHNHDAKVLIDTYKMKANFYTARMYRNGQPNLPLNKIFGITSFELG